MVLGQVIKTYNGFYYVQPQEKGKVIQESNLISCRVRGKLKRFRNAVVTGDYVKYQLLEDGTGIIEECMPRKNLLYRPLVANIDQVVLTFAAKEPDLSRLLLNRFLVLAEWSQIPEIIICINKIDLLDWEQEQSSFKIYEEAGYKILPVSAAREKGIEALREHLQNRVTVFAGPSGAGKSSLLNRVEQGFSLATGNISDKIKRGKHTTRAACLLSLPGGGTVVDTPGFSAAEMEQIDKNSLGAYFPEFKEFMIICRYNTCTHSHEPECGIKQAVQAGKISQERYEAYLNILQSINDRRKVY